MTESKALAIMQPYFLPYIGYFQLINACDLFVIYDDVNYIKGGWIDRNKIIINNSEFYFKIPIVKASSNAKINELEIVQNNWKQKMFKQLSLPYATSPYYKKVSKLIESILFADFTNLAEYVTNSISLIIDYLDLNREVKMSSELNIASFKSGQERIISMTKELKFNTYINPIGGNSLYNKNEFKQNGIELKFLRSFDQPYIRGKFNYHPYLSVVDLMYYLDVDEIKEQLANYNFV